VKNFLPYLPLLLGCVIFAAIAILALNGNSHIVEVPCNISNTGVCYEGAR
jgi:hypothetical protein